MQQSPADTAPRLALPIRRRQTPWLRRAIVFVGCVVLVDAVFGERGVAGGIRARQEYQRVSESLAKLKDENAGLREQARRLQQDPAAIEALARRDLGLIRPG